MAGLEDLLGGILGNALGGGQQQQAANSSGIPDFNKIMMMAGPLIAALAANGGLQKILGQLTGGGAQQANSWVQTDTENEPISPEQVKSLLPAEVDKVAAETGMHADEVASGISAILPGLVDKMTPQGKVLDPQADSGQLADLLKGIPGGDMLKGLFG